MTTQELHIQLELLLQKVNSHWNQNFLPQEKDLFINREVIKYIKQRINPLSNNKRLSIFDVLKRVQDLNPLIKTVTLDVVSINSKEDAVHLPFDFLYYINSEGNVTPRCEKNLSDEVDVLLYKKTFKSLTDLDGTTSFIVSITKDGTDTIVFDMSTLPTQYLPQDDIPDYKKVFILNNAIYNVLKLKLPDYIEVKYNTYLKQFELRSYEDYVLTVTRNGSTYETASSTSSFKGNNQDNQLEAEIRVVDEEFKTVLKRSYLSKSTDESSIAYLRDTLLILPKNENVVHNKVNLTYICKPAKVDVLLDHNSDLPDVILDEIISNTAQTLKGVIASDSYEKFTQENMLIE